MAESELELCAGWGRLCGTLLVPDGAAPCSVALLIAGSGATDRDGNDLLASTPIDNLKLLARALARRGVASLRFDKRGVGASQQPGLRESALRFEYMVDDALLWAGHLARDPRFTGVVLVGHSEGALVATLAAESAPASALVSLAAAGQPAGALMGEQLGRVLPPALARRAIAGLRQLEAQQPVDDVPDELFLLLRPTVQPYLMSWFRHDPAQLLARLGLPVLLVHGAADTQVPPQQARLLQAGQPQARLRVLDGVDHGLALQGDFAAGTEAVATEVLAWLREQRLVPA